MPSGTLVSNIRSSGSTSLDVNLVSNSQVIPEARDQHKLHLNSRSSSFCESCG